MRLGAFGIALLVLTALQWHWPTRGDGRPAQRQLTNLTLVLIDSLVLRLLFPVLAVGLAIAIEARSGGLFGALNWPGGSNSCWPCSCSIWRFTGSTACIT